MEEVEVEEVEGKNEEWISLWEAPTVCVPGALCELARSIHGAEKRWGQPAVNLGVMHSALEGEDPEVIGATHRKGVQRLTFNGDG